MQTKQAICKMAGPTRFAEDLLCLVVLHVLTLCTSGPAPSCGVPSQVPANDHCMGIGKLEVDSPQIPQSSRDLKFKCKGATQDLHKMLLAGCRCCIGRVLPVCVAELCRVLLPGAVTRCRCRVRQGIVQAAVAQHAVAGAAAGLCCCWLALLRSETRRIFCWCCCSGCC